MTKDNSQERIEVITDELHKLRFGFGWVDDDYRQAKIDVALEMIDECGEMIDDYQECGMWPEEKIEELDFPHPDDLESVKHD
jgi:hypothetical protein